MTSLAAVSVSRLPPERITSDWVIRVSNSTSSGWYASLAKRSSKMKRKRSSWFSLLLGSRWLTNWVLSMYTRRTPLSSVVKTWSTLPSRLAVPVLVLENLAS